MQKEFNITGTCFPEQHFMADLSEKLRLTMRFVETGKYFTIHRPRQYGKTTLLRVLSKQINQMPGFLAISSSFEGLGDAIFQEEQRFCQKILVLLFHELTRIDKSLAAQLEKKRASDFDELANAISELVETAQKKIVLLIDEVDKSSNNQLFLSFLGMLRNQYLNRVDKPAFHSVVLAGLHDVKSLKLKIRPESEQKFNSPWNIATDFKVEMSLLPKEIQPMLEEYAAERGVNLDAAEMSERLFFYTSGYPFLVSKLCKMMDEEVLPMRKAQNWTAEDLEKTVQQLVKENNTNFDTLVKNLENNEELYQFVYQIVVEAKRMPFNAHDSLIQFGVMHGILAKNGFEQTVIQNRIYREVIANFMESKALRSGQTSQILLQAPTDFARPDGSLDMNRLLERFQNFMKTEYSRHDRNFLERHGRLVFLAFLKPILNGRGYTFKEPQISEERRLDVAITFGTHKYICELKLWRGETAHEEGLRQLADYLKKENLEEGWLVVFDHSEVKNWRQENIEIEGRRIFAIWV